MKKELGFPVSGSAVLMTGCVLSAVRMEWSTPPFFLLSFVSHFFLYIHPSRPFSSREAVPDEGKGEVEIEW
jgi:hypothetical protein